MTDAVEAARRLVHNFQDIDQSELVDVEIDALLVARALLTAVEALTLAEPYVVLCGMISARLDTTEECERIAQVIANARGPR